MAGVNKVILVGNLGSDIEIKYSQSGQAIAPLSIATSESWTDKNTGQKQEQTEWHRVILFGKLAEIANQYLHKGSKVYIEGKLQTRKWQDNNGNDKYSTEVIVSGFNGTLQMLDKKETKNDDYSNNYSQDNTQKQNNAQKQNNTQKQDNTQKQNNTNSNTEQPKEQVKTTTQPDDFEDDIPF